MENITIARNNGGNVRLHSEKYGLKENGLLDCSSFSFENAFGDFLDEAKSFSQSQKIFFPKYTPGLFL